MAKKAVTEAVDAVYRAVRDGSHRVISGTFENAGWALEKSVDAVEAVEERIDRADRRIEDGAGAVFRETAGLVSDQAKPGAERAGRAAYKLGKLVVNVTGLPGTAQKAVDALRIMRPKR